VRAEGDRVVMAAFAICNVSVATTPIAVRFTNRELDPVWGAGLRFAVCAVLFIALSAVLGVRLPRGRALAGGVLFGTLNFAATVGLAYYAFVRIHAGVGQTLFALTPLVTLLLAVLQRQEHLRLRAIAGAVLALGGVALLSEAPLRGGIPALSLVALLGSLLSVSQAAVLIRHLPHVHPVAMNTVGTVTAAVILIPICFLVGESPELPHRAATWAAVAYTISVGSMLMFMLYLFVLGRWAASRTAYVFVLSPFLTVLLSAWLDDEPVGWSLFLGGAVIVVGVYIGALRPRPIPVPAVPPP
jgi:drug/metabolite transporter (DMT)-like permease